ncbi:serine-rich adhesin for platelets-like [Branchiostoma lanceolatum]|uniref:serine-rich adhesin for platelets-like n=1 Tax=Branchiostoma lanceolatum TaxID=7740 RepID=UPI003454E206
MASHDISQEIQDDVLSCPICNNQLTEPKALPCQHTYCCNCLQELARRADNRRLHCPECRKTVTIPAKGVQAFPTNFLVANVLDKVQQCKEEKKKQADETDMCDVHKQEAQVVCDTCNVVVCNVCLKSGHKEHVFKHIDQEKASKLKEVKSLIKKAKDVSTGIFLVKKRLQRKHNEVKRQIESSAAEAMDIIQCLKKSLLKDLNKRKARKIAKINHIEGKHNALHVKSRMGRATQPAEEAISGNKQVLYKDISYHYSCLSAALSEGAEYQATHVPLLEEVRRLKFVPSSLEQPMLLGHIDEEIDSPSGSNPSSSGTSGNVVRANTKKRAGESLTSDEWDHLNSSDEEDTNLGPASPSSSGTSSKKVINYKAGTRKGKQRPFGTVHSIKVIEESDSLSSSEDKDDPLGGRQRPFGAGRSMKVVEESDSIDCSSEDDNPIGGRRLDLEQPVRVKKSILSPRRSNHPSAAASRSSNSNAGQPGEVPSSIELVLDDDPCSSIALKPLSHMLRNAPRRLTKVEPRPAGGKTVVSSSRTNQASASTSASSTTSLLKNFEFESQPVSQSASSVALKPLSHMSRDAPRRLTKVEPRPASGKTVVSSSRGNQVSASTSAPTIPVLENLEPRSVRGKTSTVSSGIGNQESSSTSTILKDVLEPRPVRRKAYPLSLFTANQVSALTSAPMIPVLENLEPWSVSGRTSPVVARRCIQQSTSASASTVLKDLEPRPVRVKTSSRGIQESASASTSASVSRSRSISSSGASSVPAKREHKSGKAAKRKKMRLEHDDLVPLSEEANSADIDEVEIADCFLDFVTP